MLNGDLKSEGMAKVFFDRRLSTDSFMADGSRDINNMLKLNMRTPDELVLVELDPSKHAPRTLFYKSIMDAGESCFKPTSLGFLPPFPPESTYHMQTNWGFYEDAYRGFYRLHGSEIGEGRTRFTTAIRIWASSVQPASVTFVPSLLTECAVSCVDELPCITYEGGYMFTLLINQLTGSVRIQPTNATSFPMDSFAELTHGKWHPLPIKGERTFQFSDLGIVQCAGLRMDLEDDCLELRLPRDTSLKCSDAVYPFLYFPLINWNTLLAVQLVGEQIETPDGAMRIVKSEEHFERLSAFELPLDEWLAENPDCPDRASGVTLHVHGTNLGECYWLRRVLCAASNNSQLFFYSSKRHLFYDLRNNGGGPCEFELTHRESWDEMICTVSIFDPSDFQSFCVSPLLKDAEDSLFLREYRFDTDDFEIAKARHTKASESHKAAVTVAAHLDAKREAARAASTKRQLAWDVDWTKADEAAQEYAVLLESRAGELASAEAALAQVATERSHSDTHLGKTPRRTLLATPRTPHLPGQPLLAVLKANPSTGSFMTKGKYYAEFLSPAGHEGVMVVDFVTASEVMLREGQRVFVNMCPQLLEDMQALYPGLTLTSDDLTGGETRALNTGKCKLEAFYVLGDTTKTQAGEFANMGCARICIQPVGAEKFIFFIALHHAYTVGIVTTHEQNLSVEMQETDFLATVCFGEHQPGHVHAPTRGEGLCWL